MPIVDMSESSIFERKIYSQMLDWKNRYGRSRALLIEGARRVGKSTIVRSFVKNEFKSSIIIDFSTQIPDVRNYFIEYGDNLDRLFLFLQSRYNVILEEGESAIVFDEVQLFPPARQMIKHLVADGRFSYIETGSLISLRQNVKDILIPSEERRIQMHPMDFEEFQWAQGNKTTIPFLRKMFNDREPLGFDEHRRMMREYMLYVLVGGMPQAVEAFVTNNDFQSVEEVKRDILNLYLDDVMKIPGNLGIKSREVLEHIPANLSRHDKSFSASEIRKNSATREYYSAITWLKESKIVNACFRSSNPNPALELYYDRNTVKLYMLDTGLLVTSMFRSNIANRDELYRSILDNKLDMNRGMILENIVSQELTAKNLPLVFSKFYIEGSTNVQEVDFIMADAESVTPIEVKSGVSSKHASLDRFMVKYRDLVKEAYVVHTKNLRVDGAITYVPAYMTMFI